MHSGQELLEASIVALVFALGLRTEPTPRIASRERRLLIRTLLTRDIFVPLAVMSILSTLGVEGPAILGATLLAISPGLPSTLRGELKGGGYARLVFRSSSMGVMLSIASVPFWLAIVSRFSVDASTMPLAVARLMAVLFLLPFALGVAMRRMARKAMAKASEPVMLLADLLLLIASVPLVAEMLPRVSRLGTGYGLIVAAVTAFVLLVASVAGGPHASDRSAVALICASRHPGLALLIAHGNFAGDLVLPAVLVGFVIVTLVTLPYAYWRRHHEFPEPTAQSPSTVAADAPMLAPPVTR